ncbi:SDR family NAD(P)-dependent oxidoreductase [Paenibacillus hodogayensis]|uniref:SDR family NAD(P)-dependent oxidoreductase n=1 Tax=Paenibacillus hodogayensis TaxID=279208 RepID=A0ABV5W063_9BACL
MGLQGKVAVITGAGAGIGKATAILFAREGCKLVINDYNPQAAEQTVAEIRALGGQAVMSCGDVASQEVALRTVETAVDAFGTIDILFNNAGIVLPGEGYIVDVTEEVWDQTIRVNLKGTYQFCKAVLPLMVKQGGGSIINASSIVALTGGYAWDAYTASKGGVLALTRSLAVEYGASHIRVNAICPGIIRTAMTEKDINNPEEHQALLASTPMRRLGSPDEVAQSVLFLASDASSFITGIALPIDGGWTAM